MQRSLISLGWRCDTAFQLRMHGHENVAHFFDWLSTPLHGLFETMKKDFNVFYPENLILRTDISPHSVEDNQTGIIFHHQFPLYCGNMQPNFLLHYPSFISKFRYLAARFRDYMANRPVTLVRQNIDYGHALELENLTASIFPKADVQFLYLNPHGEEFSTPLGVARQLQQEGSLGNPAEWARVLCEQGLIDAPYRHTTKEILGAHHDDYNLAVENRFTVEQIRVAVKSNPEKIGYQLELAHAHMLRMEWLDAANVSKNILEQDQKNTEAIFIHTISNFKNKKITASHALDILLNTVDINSAPPKWLEEISHICISENRIDLALQYIRRAISMQPDQVHLYYFQSEILYMMQDYAGIVQTLCAAKRISTLDHHYSHMLANGLEACGRIEDALEATDQALEEHENFNYFFTKAGILIKLRRMPEAAEVCERARPFAGEFMPALEQRINAIRMEMNTM